MWCLTKGLAGVQRADTPGIRSILTLTLTLSEWFVSGTEIPWKGFTVIYFDYPTGYYWYWLFYWYLVLLVLLVLYGWNNSIKRSTN